METDRNSSSADIARLRLPGDARARRRRRRVPALLALLLLGIAGGAAYVLRDRILDLGPEVRTGPVVKTGGAADRAILTANGYVTARRQAGVTAKVTGRIKKLHKDLGDRVTKDEVLAELEDDDLQAALAEVKATLWLSELEVKRARELAARSIASQADYDMAVAKSREVTARLQNVEEQIENTLVRAPFDGVIIVKNGEVGETVSLFGAQTSRKSGPIFVVADFNEFEVEADVNEANIARIQAGQAAEIALDAVPDHTYRGKLRQIVPTADRQKATIQVKVSLLDPDDKVYPEMSAKVTFLKGDDTAPEPVRILAPAEAIVEKDGRRVAFVMEAGRVREVPVQTGKVIGVRIVVTSGLVGGEAVVLSPPPNLTQGDKVRALQIP